MDMNGHMMTSIVRFTIVILLWFSITTMPDLSYSREELLSIGASCKHNPVTLDVYHTLQQYGICSGQPSRRGRRSFHKDQHPIPVLTRPRTHLKLLQRDHERKQDKRDLVTISSHSLTNRDLTESRNQQPQQNLPSIMLLNARSLSNKVDDLLATVDTLCKDVHLIAVTETWFSEEKPASACTLQGYEQFHHDRESRHWWRRGTLCTRGHECYSSL